MANYLVSLSVVFAVNFWSNYSLRERLKEIGYIDKTIKNKSLLGYVLSAIMVLTPGLNVILAGISAAFTVRALVDDNFLLKMFKMRSYSSEAVKSIYERNNVQEEVLRDALTLDGADEQLIQDEIKIVEKQKCGYETKDSYSGYLPSVPEFNDEEYLWACVEEYAKQVIDVISLDADLTDDQREYLLHLFRKECKAELMGKERSGEKIMKKVLNVIE